MFNFGSLLQMVGMGKQTISPDVAPGAIASGGSAMDAGKMNAGGFLNLGNLFTGKQGTDGTEKTEGSGLSTILQTASGALNQNGGEQTPAIAEPAPINVVNPAPNTSAQSATETFSSKAGGRLKSLNLSDLLRGGNING